MSNYRCIVVGINQYQAFSPLRYGHSDAQSLYRFLLQRGGFSPEKSLLVTDISLDMGEHPVIPQRNTIISLLNTQNDSLITQFLWLFFKGYGVHYQGEDYLMPIDGNPHDIVNTGISMRSLFTALLNQGSQAYFVLLDVINIPNFAPLGQATLNLAKQMRIGIIISTQADEINVTTTNPGQGLFITALLEALWYYRHHLTLAKLDEYLRDRYLQFGLQSRTNLPSPVIFSPSLTMSHQLLLPTPSTSATGSLRQPPQSSTTLPPLPTPPKVETETNNPHLKPETRLNPVALVKRVIIGGGLTLVASLLLLKWLQSRQASAPVGTLPQPTTTQSPAEGLFLKNQAIVNQARTHLTTNQASDFNRAIGEVRPLSGESGPAIVRWSEVIYDIAQGRAKLEDFTQAIAAARLVPRDHPSLYTLAQQNIEQWQQQIQHSQKNQVLIDGAKALVKPNQASSYNRAMMILRQIPANEPGYKQANSLVEQWSQQIYQIAQNRAKQGKWQQAIATAQLIPSKSAIYPEAQKAIEKWHKQKQ